MSDIEHSAPHEPENRRSRFSRFHARTYEMELLVSGAVVFGLVRLPPVVDRAFTSFMAGLDGNLRLVGVLGQAYLQLVLYGLIAVFVFHLAMRGFWIGLLGLESVFPDGIRWDHVKQGPILKKRYRASIGSLAQAVEKVDDLCSLIFSFGFLIIFVWIYFVILIVVAAGLAVGFSWIFLDGKAADTVFWIIAGFVLVTPMLADLIDKKFGHRIKPGGFGERIIERMVAVAYALSPMRAIGATSLTLASNTSNTKVSVVILVVMFGLALVQMGGGVFGQGVVRLDSLTFFPDTLREHGVDPRHYRALRGQNSIEPLMPTIQDDIVDGPFVKLFIPYNPRRHNRLVAEVCPDLESLSKNGLDAGKGQKLEDVQVQKTAACLGSLFQISIDGQSADDLRFDFTIEQESGLEGLVSFLPIDGLERGRHELVIFAPPRPSRSADASKTPDPVRHLIPFWL